MAAYVLGIYVLWLFFTRIVAIPLSCLAGVVNYWIIASKGTKIWLANGTRYRYAATAGGTDLGIRFWLTGRVRNCYGQGANKCIARPSISPRPACCGCLGFLGIVAVWSLRLRGCHRHRQSRRGALPGTFAGLPAAVGVGAACAARLIHSFMFIKAP